MIGYAMCGSFCTHGESVAAMRRLVSLGHEIQPIMSEIAYSTDTRFQVAYEQRCEIEELCKRKIIHTITDAEPLGPSQPLDALIIAPCTGNTLAKLANGITDTAVTMAAKAHLRCDRTLLIALATNDAMSQNLGNIGRLLTRKSVYFVPMKQDSPKNKPHSLVADFSMIEECFYAAVNGEQIRPLFV